MRSDSVTDVAPTVSIVVATRRRHAGFTRLLESLHANSDPRLEHVELVVVEDGPPYLQAVRWPGPVKHIRHAQREGLARCRNEGIDSSAAPLVAFLDDDGVCSPGWLHEVLEAFADEHTTILAGVVVASDGGKNLYSALRDRLYYLETFGPTYGPAASGTAGDRERVPYASGGISVYRREMFDRYGLFDTDLPASIDTEWAARLAVGDRPVLRRSMVLVHDHPSTAASFYRRCFTAGVTRGRLARKGRHRGHPALGADRMAREAVERLLWKNLGRAARVEGHKWPKVWLALQAQAVVFVAGMAFGRFSPAVGRPSDGPC